MRRFIIDDLEEDLGPPDIEPRDRFRIVVEFIVRSESTDDAEESVKDVIEQGILGLMDTEEREPIDEWDVIEAEPAEIL